MKARLPKGYSNGVSTNFQQLAMKAQKMQEEMEVETSKLEEKEYEAVSPGGDIKVIINGKLEVKNIEINAELVSKDNIEMLSDMIIIAVNSAIRNAIDERNEKMQSISGQLNFPGMF